MSSKSWLYVLTLCYLTSKIVGLPVGIVVTLDIECGKNKTGVANVTLLTDVDYVKPVALCEDNKEVELERLDDFRWTTLVKYPDSTQPGITCVFMRKYPGVDVFTITIEVAHEVNGILLQDSDDLYSLTCSFGDELDGEDAAANIDDGQVPPNGVADIKGRNMTSPVRLDVIGYDGLVFPAGIPLGKIARLKATFNVAKNETAVRAFSCQALSYDGSKSYDLLIGGCGDGRIFPKNYGFTTQGNITYSPYFKAFRLGGDSRIKFKCMFTACQKQGGCDGSSCFKSTQ